MENTLSSVTTHSKNIGEGWGEVELARSWPCRQDSQLPLSSPLWAVQWGPEDHTSSSPP